MMEILCVIICVLAMFTMIFIIGFQYKTIDNLTKKLMARNYTEFAAFEEKPEEKEKENPGYRL